MRLTIVTILLLSIFTTIDCAAKDFWEKFDEKTSWNKEEVALGAGGLLLHGIDWTQTLKFSRNLDEYYERSPFIGKHPSKGRVNTCMGISAAAKIIVPHFLPRDCTVNLFGWRIKTKPKRIMQCVFIGVSGCAVGHNYSIGLRFDL